MSFLTIHDESFSGSILNLMKLKTSRKKISVRELIKMRVYEEVKAYNSKKTLCYRGLVCPENAEKVLNGYKLKRRAKLNPEQQFYTTMDVYNQRGFSILVDEQPVSDLDQHIKISNNTRVSFLR